MSHHPACDAAATAAPGTSRLNLCRAALWSERARELVVADQRPRQVFESLIEADHFSDAIRFLSIALPKRQSVWWGALCVKSAYGDSMPADDHAAFAATLDWLREPTELNRRNVEVAGKQASVQTPAGALAVAAFMSGGSISLPHLPRVAPRPEVTGRLVAGAILLAAVRREPMQYLEHYQQYLAIGREVADGRLGWLSTPRPNFEGISLHLDMPQATIPTPHFSVGHHHQGVAMAAARGKPPGRRRSSRQ
jgi:hypothetical protein